MTGWLQWFNHKERNGLARQAQSPGRFAILNSNRFRLEQSELACFFQLPVLFGTGFWRGSNAFPEFKGITV